MDGRVEGLDAAVHHLGKAGQVADVADGKAGASERRGRAAGRDELDAALGERPRQRDEPGLVGNGKERAGYAAYLGQIVLRTTGRLRSQPSGSSDHSTVVMGSDPPGRKAKTIWEVLLGPSGLAKCTLSSIAAGTSRTREAPERARRQPQENAAAVLRQGGETAGWRWKRSIGMSLLRQADRPANTMLSRPASAPRRSRERDLALVNEAEATPIAVVAGRDHRPAALLATVDLDRARAAQERAVEEAARPAPGSEYGEETAPTQSVEWAEVSRDNWRHRSRPRTGAPQLTMIRGPSAENSRESVPAWASCDIAIGGARPVSGRRTAPPHRYADSRSEARSGWPGRAHRRRRGAVAMRWACV